MSSFATAPSRATDKEAQNGKQLHLLNTPDEAPETKQAETAAAAPAIHTSTTTAQTLDEVNRVERLLSQLEARSLALVPYNYGNLREVPVRKSNNALLAGVLVAIWLGSVVLAVAYLRYSNHAPALTDRAALSTPLVIPSDADSQDQKVANSVDHLAKALVSSSERMNELQAAMDRSNRDLQRIATKVNSADHAKLGSANPSAEASPTTTAVTVTPPLPKNWHRVLELKPTDSAVPHKGADGNIDYWFVQRGTDASPSKVLPIGTSTDGVVIHNLEDGKDYTLTPTGEWRNGSLAPSGN